jgi:hypothetical protein
MKTRKNWVDSEDMAMLYDGPYPTSFYHHLHSALHAEFRLQRARKTGIGGSPKALLGNLRDRVMLPLLRGRLAIDRMRHRPSRTRLPVALNRDQASTPSPS